MNAFDVKVLDPRDPAVAEAIRAVMFEGYGVEASILGVDDFVPLRRTAASIASADATFVAAVAGHSILGVAELERAAHGGMHIGSLVVSPRHFRRGIGTTLLRWIVDRHGDGALTVSTGSRNAPAIALYERLGFAAGERWETPDGIPMVTLRRDVTAPE